MTRIVQESQESPGVPGVPRKPQEGQEGPRGARKGQESPGLTHFRQRNFLVVWDTWGSRRPAGGSRPFAFDFACFPMVQWCGICVIKKSGEFHIAISSLFGIHEEPGSQQGDQEESGKAILGFF